MDGFDGCCSQVAHTTEKTQGGKKGLTLNPRQLNHVGSTLGLSAITGQLAALLRAWERLERGSGRSAMLLVVVMLLQQLMKALMV